MIGEIDLAGVLVAPLLVYMFVAYLVSLPLRAALARVGFYDVVWHRALVDAALLALLTGAVNAAALAWFG